MFRQQALAWMASQTILQSLHGILVAEGAPYFAAAYLHEGLLALHLMVSICQFVDILLLAHWFFNAALLLTTVQICMDILVFFSGLYHTRACGRQSEGGILLCCRARASTPLLRRARASAPLPRRHRPELTSTQPKVSGLSLEALGAPAGDP